MKSIFFPFVHTSSRLWLTFMRKETSNKEAVSSCFLNGLPPHHDSLWAFFSGSVTAYWYAQFSIPLHSSQISFHKSASPYYTLYWHWNYFMMTCFFFLPLTTFLSLPVQPTSKRCQVMLNRNFWLQLPSFYLFEKEYLNRIFVCFQSKYNLFFLCRWWCGTCFRLFQQWAVSIKLESFIGNEWKNMGLIPSHQSNPYLGCLPSVLD